jgi:CPA1 family monovalent cation:H+ antiporter
MHETELVLLGLLTGLVFFLLLAYRSGLPYPIPLVIGGCVLGYVPGVPDVRLSPEIVLLAFLPPLLYSAAFFSSLLDLRSNLGPIMVLAIGLVVATMVGVAVVIHAVSGMPWAPAFVLGAVVSPTDPVAASEIAGRLGAKRRYMTIIEGESLVNDATALILYKYAVAAVTAGTFSLLDAGGHFALASVGGVAIGLGIGYVVAELRKRIDDPMIEISISLATAYLAYLPAAAVGASGVLAAVTAGVYLGWRSPELITPATRLQLFSIWEIVQFVLNAVLFTLVGLQLPSVLDGISDQSAGLLARDAALVIGTVLVVRALAVVPFAIIRSRFWEGEWFAPAAAITWTGMRGAVTLAAALALPAFPERDLVIFLAFAVVVFTVVVQGLTLPALIRKLDFYDDGRMERKEAKARILAAKAAIERIEQLREEEWVRPDSADRMRGLYEFRIRRFRARFDDADDGSMDEQSAAYQRLRRMILDAERTEVYRLRRAGTIDDPTMHRIERDLDLEDARLEI